MNFLYFLLPYLMMDHWMIIECSGQLLIDPHSMDSAKTINVNPKFKKYSIRKNTEELPKFNSNIKTQCEKSTCQSGMYYKRSIRLLLNNAQFNKDLDTYDGHISIKLSKNDYDLLIKFSKSDESDVDSFADVNAVLEGAFQKSTYEHYTQTIISMQELIYMTMFNDTSFVLYCTVFALYVLYKLYRAHFTLWTIFKYFTGFAYVVDFAVTYLHLLEALEVDNLVTVKSHGHIPPECNTKHMSWWTYFKTTCKSAFFESDCQQYYKATHLNLKYLITPLKVFSHQFKVISDEIGSAIGKFGSSMYNALPLGSGVIIFPIMMMAAVYMIYMIFCFVTKSHVKFTIFYGLISHEMKPNIENRKQTEKLPSREAKQVLIIEHRNLVEDVKPRVKPKKLVEKKKDDLSKKSRVQTDKEKEEEMRDKDKPESDTTEHESESEADDEFSDEKTIRTNTNVKKENSPKKKKNE